MYGAFAGVYDVLMADVPYDEWAAHVAKLIRRYGISRPVRDPAGSAGGLGGAASAQKAGGKRTRSDGEAQEELLRQERDLVVDLGCGTGSMTTRLAGLGYDLVGIDRSADMLAVVQENNRDGEMEIPLLCQDMRSLDLYCTAGTFISVCDTVNYLITDRDVIRAFSGVRKFLYPGGIFIFDFNTLHKYRDVIGSATIAERGEEVSFIWENDFRARSGRNEARITFFVRGEDDTYRCFEETHVQRGYTLTQMRGLLRKAGLTVVTACDADTWKKPHAASERIFVVARGI